MAEVIPPRSGVAFELRRGQCLRVIDPEGEQVADLLAFRREDVGEAISSGRSLDYASRIFLSTGDALYSNRSRVMLRIVEDEVGRHDFLLTPCSAEMFRIIYGETQPHRGCFGNLAAALAPVDGGHSSVSGELRRVARLPLRIPPRWTTISHDFPRRHPAGTRHAMDPQGGARARGLGACS